MVTLEGSPGTTCRVLTFDLCETCKWHFYSLRRTIVPIYFEIHPKLQSVLVQTNPDRRTRIHANTQIYRSDVVTTTSRSPQTSSEKTVG